MGGRRGPKKKKKKSTTLPGNCGLASCTQRRGLIEGGKLESNARKNRTRARCRVWCVTHGGGTGVKGAGGLGITGSFGERWNSLRTSSRTLMPERRESATISDCKTVDQRMTSLVTK